MQVGRAVEVTDDTAAAPGSLEIDVEDADGTIIRGDFQIRLDVLYAHGQHTQSC